ncbi:MAG: hypothetical protein LUG14_12515 [Synergistaceae bacterium]|nr:hypothetical protein [Synergistaceae bacterium]
MQTYKIPLVPGPSSVPLKYREAYLTDYGSTDLENDFFALLAENISLLQQVLKTKNSVIIGSGEAMMILWGALKSVVKPGDRVLAVSPTASSATASARWPRRWACRQNILRPRRWSSSIRRSCAGRSRSSARMS